MLSKISDKEKELFTSMVEIALSAKRETVSSISKLTNISRLQVKAILQLLEQDNKVYSKNWYGTTFWYSVNPDQEFTIGA